MGTAIEKSQRAPRLLLTDRLVGQVNPAMAAFSMLSPFL